MSKRKLLTAFAVFVLAGAVALAASPHFVGKVTAAALGSNLVVSWKEAGLGGNQNINYVASAFATANYVCANNGGQCPNAANKSTVAGPVSAAGTFSSGKNGQITASLTLNPPSAGSFTCPSGQTLTLSQVTYSNIQITDTTNGITEVAVPGTVQATAFLCP